jgi:hypothetical protein
VVPLTFSYAIKKKKERQVKPRYYTSWYQNKNSFKEKSLKMIINPNTENVLCFIIISRKRLYFTSSTYFFFLFVLMSPLIISLNSFEYSIYTISTLFFFFQQTGLHKNQAVSFLQIRWLKKSKSGFTLYKR